MPASRLQIVLLVLLVGLATAARLAYGHWIHAPRNSIYSDMEVYQRQARHLRQGLLGPDDTFFPMGYPAMIAGAHAASSNGFKLIAVVQSVAGGLTCLLAYLLGRRFSLSPAWAIAAAAVVAIYPPFIHYGSLLLTEGISPFLFTLIVWLMVRAGDTGRWWWAAALGITFSVASLVRTNFLPFAAVIVLCIWVGLSRQWRIAAKQLAIVMLTALPLLVVACSLNSSLIGRWTGPSTNGGLNFFMMQAEVAMVQYYDLHIGPIRNMMKYKGAYEAEMPFFDEPYYYREGMRLVRARPWRAAVRTADGLPEAVGLGGQTYWPAPRLSTARGIQKPAFELMRRALRLSARAFFFVLVVPPLLAILALAARRRLFDPEHVVWLAVAGSFAVMLVTSLLFLADPRMHVPYDALLIVSSIAAVAWAWRTATRRHVVQAATVALLALTCVSGRMSAQQPSPPAQVLPPVSPSAQRIYDDARGQLLQVRTLLKGQDSQASVGSGFLVSDRGHILTNYHVVSQAALQPQRFRLVYSASDRSEGALQILAFDAIHDLALVKPESPTALTGHRPLTFRQRDQSIPQGARIYSLGNPLDIGFAVIEGTYNGLVERSFYPTIFFAGSLNPGVSGGPTLDQEGRVIGVNVAARRDGEQVSFLVPAAFAEDLLQRGRDAAPLKEAAYPELTRQLMTHQAQLTERFLGETWRHAAHPRYRIPLPQEHFMRCWGRSTSTDEKGLEFERSDCRMDSRVFVSGWLTTGALSFRHEAYDGRKLGTLRFADRYTTSFRNEQFGGPGGKEITAPQCHERYVDRGGLPLRVVLCVKAYKKLSGLYDASMLVATVDEPRIGVLGRFDARGVSFENALKLSEHYLEGFGWTTTQSAGR